MRLARAHAASALLAAVAITGLLLSHRQRETAAREYADAARYNRAITSFLREHRDRFVQRDVGVFGVSGLSPFSLTSGRYLSRVLGEPSSWHVYVARDDPFYPLGTLPDSLIEVHPESSACGLAARAAYVVFDDEGRGRIAKDCHAALAAAHPPPEVEDWKPKRVTPEMAAAGFVVAVTGYHLGGAVSLHLAGRRVPTVHARHNRLMTASIPPDSAPGSAIVFTIEHRGAPAFQATIDVGR